MNEKISDSSSKKRPAKGIFNISVVIIILSSLLILLDGQANYDQERDALLAVSDTILEKYSSFITEVRPIRNLLLSFLSALT